MLSRKNSREKKILKNVAEILKVDVEKTPETAKKFFEEWKSQRKEIERLKEMEILLLKDEILRNVKKEKDILSYLFSLP